MRSQLEVTSPGKAKLSFNSANALSIWIDGKRVLPASGSPHQVILDLPRGLHTIAVGVDLARRHAGIRCVVEDIPGSPGRTQAVLGN
jgi:hypothetical protein